MTPLGRHGRRRLAGQMLATHPAGPDELLQFVFVGLMHLDQRLTSLRDFTEQSLNGRLGFPIRFFFPSSDSSDWHFQELGELQLRHSQAFAKLFDFFPGVRAAVRSCRISSGATPGAMRRGDFGGGNVVWFGIGYAGAPSQSFSCHDMLAYTGLLSSAVQKTTRPTNTSRTCHRSNEVQAV